MELRVRLQLAVLLTCCLSLSSCAILSPQIHDKKLFETEYAPQAKNGITPAKSGNFVGDLPAAIDAASAQGRAYFNAAGQYSTLRNTVPLFAGVTGISALLLGAMDNGSQDLRLGLAGVSAASLGIAGFYDNRPRQLIYLAGATAITCAIAAQKPLLVTDKTQNTLTADTNGLRAALTKFSGELNTNRAREGAVQLFNLEKAMQAIDAANVVLRDAASYEHKVDTAGVALREKVKEIVAAVDTQVVKTDPDPQAMKGVLASFGAAFPKAGAAPKVEALANRPTSGGGDWFDAFVVNIINLTGTLRADLDALAVDANKVQESMAACKVPDVPGALKVDPDETSHSITKLPSNLVYSIRGGTLPISAGLSGEYPVGAFTSETTSKDGSLQVSVAITAAAKGHTATLNIADNSGSPPRHIDISVSDSAEVVVSQTTTPVPQVKKPAPPKAPPLSADLTAQRLAMIRRVVQSNSSAPALTADDETAIKTYASKNKLPEELGRGSALYNAILADARNAASSLDPDAAEKEMIAGNIIAPLRQACGLAPADGAAALDKDLRAKVFDFEEQSQRGQESDLSIDGRLDAKELTAMVKAGCKVK